jgi:hypothetical protein
MKNAIETKEKQLDRLEKTDRQLWFYNPTTGVEHAVRIYGPGIVSRESSCSRHHSTKDFVSECGMIWRPVTHWSFQYVTDEPPMEGAYICKHCRGHILDHVARPQKCRVLCGITDVELGEIG